MKFKLLLLLISLSTLLSAQEKYKVDNCLHLKGIVTKNTKIYAEPDHDAYDRGVAEKFTVLYMFKYEDTDEPVKDGFYRVGKDTEMAIGFVAKSDIVEWSHRLCLGFTDLVGVGRPPALVYPTLETVQEPDWDANKKPNKKAIGQEPTLNKKLKYDMLLPVIKEMNVEKKGRNRETMSAYKIAFLGQTGDGSGINRPVSKGRTSLDLMFLIDATGSMKEEIAGAKQVINSITDRLKKVENTEVRLGISLYKDFGDEFVSRKWQGLTSDYRRVQNRLADIQVSEGGDNEEAMYQGVLHTINTTNWKKGEQNPVLRVILIIGDAPGHAYGGRYTVHADDLITKASDERVRFIAIKVKLGDDGLDNKHRLQLRDMTDGLKDSDRGLYMETEAYTGSISNAYLDALSKAVLNEVSRMQELELVRSGVKSLKDITPLNRAIFIKNLPNSGFTDIGVHFNQGWITAKNSNGRRQVEPYVYMTYNELNTYKWYCQTAISAAQSTDKRLISLIVDKVAALTGEDFDKDTEFDEYLRKVLCIPSGNTGILKFSLSDLSNWSEKRKRSMIQSMDDKVNVLDQIIRDDKVWRKPDGTDIRYTFVKLELMP